MSTEFYIQPPVPLDDLLKQGHKISDNDSATPTYFPMELANGNFVWVSLNKEDNTFEYITKFGRNNIDDLLDYFDSTGRTVVSEHCEGFPFDEA